MQNSFKAVIESDKMFHYISKPNPNNSKFGGGIKYNREKERYDITFKIGNSTTITHETTHGRQILDGYISWGKNISFGNYDYADEVEAFKNGFNYGRIFNGWKVKTHQEIKVRVLRSYGDKTFIIKDFEQHCEDGPCN